MYREMLLSKTGYIEVDLPKTDFNELLNNINDYNFDVKANKTLAGQIVNEKYFSFDLIPKNIIDIMSNACEKHLHCFGFKTNTNQQIDWPENSIVGVEIHPMNCWINFQKKGEFNPVHNHNGDLVFVIWIKIPYDLKEEINCFPESNIEATSKFQFVALDDRFCNIHNNGFIDIDKSYEGKMIIFDARLCHTVYPFFTSDEYRISVAGNIS